MMNLVSKWKSLQELSILWIVLAASSLTWIFVALADEVKSGNTEKFDTMVLLSLRSSNDVNDPLGPLFVEEMIRDFTALGGTSLMVMTTLAVVGYLLFSAKKRLAGVVLVAAVGALILSSALKQIIDRPRPDLVPHGSNVYTASFPSGHSMQAAATYLTLGVLLARVQRRRRTKTYIIFISVVVVLLVGMSRVYLGVHWPTDVLAGWAAGAGWALLCWLLARWLNRHGKLDDHLDGKF